MAYCEQGKAWTSLMLQDDGTYADWCHGCRDWHIKDKSKEVIHISRQGVVKVAKSMHKVINPMQRRTG